MSKPSTPAAQAMKSRRVRAPQDLALQYGEKTKKVRTPKISGTERKARRDAAARQKLKEFITPGDDVLARLARAGMIAASLAPVEVRDNGKTRNTRVTKSRPRQWQFQCGKCGATSTFKTPAGLCSKCGAIAVRG